MSSGTNDRIHVVTHVDIMPKYTEEGAGILRELASQCAQHRGVVRFEIWQEPPRPNHFTIVSVWENQNAFNDYLSAESTRSFREKLQPMLGSPYDERVHRLLV
jgi:quinol monooxygenase YgiN